MQMLSWTNPKRYREQPAEKMNGNRRDKYEAVECKNKTWVAVRRLRLKNSCRNQSLFALRSPKHSSADASTHVMICLPQGPRKLKRFAECARVLQPLLDCLGRKRWMEVEKAWGQGLDCQPPDDNQLELRVISS